MSLTGCFDRGGDDQMPTDDSRTVDQNNSPSKAPGKTKSSVAKKEPKPASKPAGPAVDKKVEPKKSEIDLLVEKRYPMPKILPLDQITKNWSAVPANAYPAQIVASVPVPFNLVVDGRAIGSSNVPAGTPLKPLRLAGDQLAIASLANPNMKTQIHVDKTNFKQTIQQRYDSVVAHKRNQIASLRERAKQALLAQPDRLASLQNLGPADSSDDPRFNVVKASIGRGEAHPASLEEAKSFKWNGSERVGGELAGTYNTVSVHFEVKTIFGEFPTDYKCLLSNNKVVGWIDPITEEKITR